jgi:hypothetical protein
MMLFFMIWKFGAKVQQDEYTTGDSFGCISNFARRKFSFGAVFASEAKQSQFSISGDCFASLAMTWCKEVASLRSQ